MFHKYATMFTLLLFSCHIWCFSLNLHKRNNQLVNHNRNKVVLVPCKAGTSRAMKGWWEDDLPNILGINPIEAAIIFGGLYYLYGPTVLYDYAREAGKLFSTYAPIVKDISLDLFYEFREYFEEDKERDELRKLGIDVDSTPRRTTNAIERFQSSFQTLAESEAGEEKDTNVLGDALSSPVDRELLTGQQADPKKRKTKREILEFRNVDVDQVLASASSRSRSPDDLDAALTESVMAVRDNIAIIVEQRMQANTRGVNDPTSTFMQYDFPADYIDSDSSDSGYNSAENTGSIEAMPPFAPPRSMHSLPVVPSKFQQQMTGEWNQRVLRRDKYQYGINTKPQQLPQSISRQSHYENTGDVSETDAGSYASPWESSDDYIIEADPDTEPEFDLSSIDMSSLLPGIMTASTADIPEELGSNDSLDVAACVGGVLSPTTGISAHAAHNLTAVVQSGVELLVEMDRDYARLRDKLVSFLNSNAAARN